MPTDPSAFSPESATVITPLANRPATIHLIDYDKDALQERTVTDIEDVFVCKESPTVSWINIDGLHDATLLEKLGAHFDIHPLVLEDIVHTRQRPKVEEYDTNMYVVLRMLDCDPSSDVVTSEQVSLILGPNYVISFQENVGDVFDRIRHRIRSGRKRIRSSGADYLLYALMDGVVDEYFVIQEQFGEQIETIEERLLLDPTKAVLTEIYNLKRELLTVRKAIWPLREVAAHLERSESKLIRKATRAYLRNVYDHTIQVLDTTENYRETVAALIDLYLSSISNKTNDVVKVLTMISTIFMPLSFIAGVYGMNFDYMPELRVWWAYPVLLLVMVAVAGSLIYFFRRKKWL